MSAHSQCLSFSLLCYLSFTFCSTARRCSALLVKHAQANTHNTDSVCLYLCPTKFWTGICQVEGDGSVRLCNSAELVLLMCTRTALKAANTHISGVTSNTDSESQYLVHIPGILQPRNVHLLHIVRAGAIEKGLSSHRCVQAPRRLQRP